MFIQSIVGRHLHSLQFLTVVNKAAVTSCLQNTVWLYVLFYFFGKYLGLGFLGYIVGECFNILSTAKLFSKVTI